MISHCLSDFVLPLSRLERDSYSDSQSERSKDAVMIKVRCSKAKSTDFFSSDDDSICVPEIIQKIFKKKT